MRISKCPLCKETISNVTAALTQRANDAVFDIDDIVRDADDIKQGMGAEAVGEDDDAQIVSDNKASESRFRTIADGI